MTILDIRYWRLAVFTASACIATVLSGCAGEGDEPVPSPVEGEVAEVPVTITFGTAWEQDGATRVPPPGQEADPDKIDGRDETNADKVRIVTFRRKDMDNQLQGGAVNDAPFSGQRRSFHLRPYQRLCGGLRERQSRREFQGGGHYPENIWL